MLTIKRCVLVPGQDKIDVDWALVVTVGTESRSYEGTFTMSQNVEIANPDKWTDAELRTAVGRLLKASINV